MSSTDKKTTGLKKEYVIILIICLIVGAILIFGLRSDLLSFGKSKSSNGYVDDLEVRVCEILSSIDGVGKSKVMITVEGEEVSYKNGLYSEVSSTENKYPEVVGVVIVCEGANNVMVKEEIAESVMTLLGVPFDKIQIFKMK